MNSIFLYLTDIAWARSLLCRIDNRRPGESCERVQYRLSKSYLRLPVLVHALGKEYKNIKEYREAESALNIGDEINVSAFAEGDLVKISGISKGKGFQGGVKRHGFHGRRATHGVKHEHRTIGSTGSRFPQHVIKGRKMPGRMGYERTTVKGLKIMKVDKDSNLLVLKGAVPGRTGALLEIRA